MHQSRDWDELQYVWQAWREETGAAYKDNFTEMVYLSNKAAHLEGEILSLRVD